MIQQLQHAMLSQAAPQIQQMSQQNPFMDIEGDVLSMLEEMSVIAGLKQPERKPEVSIPQPVSIPQQQQPQSNMSWLQDESPNQKIREEAKAKEAEDNFVNAPMFQGFYQEAGEFINRLAEEVANPQSPFSKKEAEREILNYVLEKTAQGGKQNV